jgi:ribosomal protein S14
MTTKRKPAAIRAESKRKTAPCNYCGRPAPAITGMRLCDECKADQAKRIASDLDTFVFDGLL